MAAPDPTQRPLLDVEAVPWPDFALTDRFEALEGEAHAHSRPQLLYARAGTLHLLTHEARWVLPPARAAWIPAGVEHRARTTGPVEIQSVYFDPTRFPAATAPGERVDPPRFLAAAAPAEIAVFEVDDLARALLAEAQRYGPARPAAEAPRAERFFAALADLTHDWLTARRGAEGFRLPRGRSAPVQRALDYALTEVAEAHLEGAARAAGQSPRTLERHLRAETGQGWRDLLRQIRLWRARDLLSDPTHSVLEVALACGYESPSAFTHAFRAQTGQTPTAWRTGPTA